MYGDSEAKGREGGGVDEDMHAGFSDIIGKA